MKERYRVHRFDISMANKKFKETGLALSTIKTDCRNTPPEIQADFATCLFNSIDFLNESGQLKAFKSLYGAIKPNGRIIVDCMNLFAIEKFIKTTERINDDGYVFWSDKTFDFEENVEHMVFKIIAPTGEIRKKEFSQMHYSPYDLADLVTRAGFKVSNIFGDYEGNPISFESSKIVLLAHK